MHWFLLLCVATKDESETESGLVGLALLLKTSGELPLGISLRAEGTEAKSILVIQISSHPRLRPYVRVQR